jgi:hypothetical protein
MRIARSSPSAQQLTKHPNLDRFLELRRIVPRAAVSCECLLERKSNMIKKVKGGYQVLSSKGRNLGGPYKSLEEAKKRLRQVEFFKHRKG